jgi:hypothetical protein
MGKQHDHEHRRVRAQVAMAMDSATTCVLCRQLTCPNTGRLLVQGWDLAHDDDKGGWLGPAHPYCNRSEWWKSPRSKRGSKTVTNRVVRASGGRLRRIGPSETGAAS